MLAIREVVSAPRSPWQNAYAERVIGSIRRECLDHVVVIGERHLLGTTAKYVDYYNRRRPHLSLAKDAPEPRRVRPPSQGRMVELPRVGGLHHEYLRGRRDPIEPISGTHNQLMALPSLRLGGGHRPSADPVPRARVGPVRKWPGESRPRLATLDHGRPRSPFHRRGG